MNKYMHMNGLGSDPNLMLDFDSIKREKRKLFNDDLHDDLLINSVSVLFFTSHLIIR